MVEKFKKTKAVFVRGLLVLLFILVFPFSACTKEKNPVVDHEVLKHVVAQYNVFLAEGYRNLNMNPLAQVATEERATKAYYHMSALGEERKKMDATQKNLAFAGIKVISPQEVEVSTVEEWEYKHVNMDSGKVMSQSVLLYELKYKLLKENERWLVADITIEREEVKSGDNGKIGDEAK